MYIQNSSTTKQQLIPKKEVLNFPITALRFEEQISLLLTWAKARESRIVCLANVHMLMEAYWNRSFAQLLKKADMVAPDGMPLVWMLKLMGIHNQNRVAGMDIFLNLCCLASIYNIRVFFLGSQQEILDVMRKKLEQEFPLLSNVGMEPLPFRPLTAEEDEALIEKVNSSGAGVIFVCLGCPKQEKWMAQHKDKINGVMIGVGAVFAVYAGLQERAPRLIRELGFEWFYRLIQEPSRLWSRYSKTIPPFIFLALKQLFWKKGVLPLGRMIDTSIEKPFFEPLFPIQQPQKIGQILLKQNLITDHDLLTALAEQKKQDKKLGEILLNLGHLTRHELNQQLKNQKIRLGEMLIEKKLISAEQLNEILLEQLHRQQGIKL